MVHHLKSFIYIENCLKTVNTEKESKHKQVIHQVGCEEGVHWMSERLVSILREGAVYIMTFHREIFSTLIGYLSEELVRGEV